MTNFWKNLWNLIDLSQKKIKVLIVFLAVFELIKLSGPYLLKIIIDTLVNEGLQNMELLIWLAVGMLLAEEIQAFFGWIINRSIWKIFIEVEYYLPIRAQKKLMDLSLSYHERENTGNKIIKVQRGVDHISELLMNLFWEVIPTFLQLAVTLIILFLVDWRLGAIFLFFTPMYIWITYIVNHNLKAKRTEVHKKWEESAGKMGQSIININTVKSFAQERREAKEYENIRGILKSNISVIGKKMPNSNFLRNSIVNLGRFSILVLGVWLVSRGDTSIGTLIFVVTVSEKAYLSMHRLSRFYDKLQDGVEAVNRFISLSKENSDIKNPARGLKPERIKGEIEFKNVFFAYDENYNNALDDVSLKIQAGTINAFVGPSGGGKTTIARMIYRHYDPKKGAILLDGHDLRQYDLRFREHLAIVPQEVEIFNDSIRNNISYANPKATFAEIKKAARIANAEEFIKDLKEGYDTDVGERGIKLSGGQRQRIGIARAILANPSILIFDEATSSLDSYSEKLIQEAMDRVSKSRTVIMIAHRLSTIRNADQIFVLENGKLVEQGSHTELSDVKRGLYARLLKLQQSGDVD